MNHFKLTAHGARFDVDSFLATTTLKPDFVWHRGDQSRFSCVHHPLATSGVEFSLGDGLALPFLKQDDVAIDFLKSHRDGLRSLARLSEVDSFILGLQYHAVFDDTVIGFALGPSLQLMWHCLDIGCTLTYYVDLERSSDPEHDGLE